MDQHGNIPWTDGDRFGQAPILLEDTEFAFRNTTIPDEEFFSPNKLYF